MKQPNNQINGTATNSSLVGTAQLEPVLLTPHQAAAKLQVSRWTIYDLIRKRMLASLKIGRRRYVPRQAIHDLVAKLAQEAA